MAMFSHRWAANRCARGARTADNAGHGKYQKIDVNLSKKIDVDAAYCVSPCTSANAPKARAGWATIAKDPPSPCAATAGPAAVRHRAGRDHRAVPPPRDWAQRLVHRSRSGAVLPCLSGPDPQVLRWVIASREGATPDVSNGI